MKERTSSAVWVVAAMLLVVALLSAYTACYYLRGTAETDPFGGGQLRRSFPSEWEATIFQPAARVESVITGLEVFSAPSLPVDADPFDAHPPP